MFGSNDRDRPPIRALCILAGMLAIAILLNGVAVQPILLNGESAPNATSSGAKNPDLTSGGQTGDPNGANGGSGLGSGSSEPTTGNGENGSDSNDDGKGSPTSMARSSIIPHSDLRIFLNELDDDGYENAEALYKAAAAFEPTCNLPHAISNEEATNLYTLVKYECPELFQLSPEFSVINSAVSGANATAIELQYIVSAADYPEQRQACEAKVTELSASMAGLSEKEKEKHCYDYIIGNCRYDADSSLAGSPYGMFVEGRAKCDGISLAMKWLLEEQGISCLVFAGDPLDGEVGHAWDSVLIDGEYRDVDVTPDVNRDEQESPALYGAFNTSRSWVRNLYTLDEYCASLSEKFGTDSMAKSYHVENNTFAPRGTDVHSFLTEQYENARSDSESFCVQFEDESDFSQAIALLSAVIPASHSSTYSTSYRTLHVSLT